MNDASQLPGIMMPTLDFDGPTGATVTHYNANSGDVVARIWFPFVMAAEGYGKSARNDLQAIGVTSTIRYGNSKTEHAL